MERLTKAILGSACIAAVAAYAPAARSADHQDAPGTKAEPTADINDVYAFNDSTSSVFAMTTFPAENLATAADGGAETALFSDAVQYVFHTTSMPAFGETDAAATSSLDIICTFSGTTAPQTYQCWAGNAEYATGTTSTAGLTGGTATSADGKLKVFIGAVADPFFFNLDGFHAAEATVEGAIATIGTDGGLTLDSFGCPTIDDGTAAFLRGELSTNPEDGGAAVDHFATFDALAIVVTIDKSIVTAGGPIVGVWGATYQAP
jgi:hypothetical protein